MTLRIVQISAPKESAEKIKELAERYDAIDCWHSDAKGLFSRNDDKRETTRILIDVRNQQDLMDALTRHVQKNEGWRITLIPVEATLPVPENKVEQQRKEAVAQKAMETGKDSGIGMAKNHVAAWFEFFNLRDILRGSVTREELQMDMEAGGKLSFDFLLLVFLSAIVAGIGLIQSDVAIIIGAMVIAPLLGPNLAMAFAAGLGNKKLFLSSLMTNIIGLSFALFISVLASFFMDMTALKESTELMNRTNISFATIALALASGAAAVLSLTTGVSSALVGVMVAVALLPPAVTLGLFTGQGQWDLAFGAGLLLATNIICINISALVIFRLKGVRPRTWYEEKTARKNARFNLILWIGILILLSALIWFKNEYMPIVG